MMETGVGSITPMLEAALNSLISAAAGLVGGVFLGGWLSDRRERAKQRTDSIKRQLSEFYGPLLSIRNELQALEQLDKEIVTADGSWSETDDSKFKAGQINSLLEKTMPSYRQLVTIFRDNLWLAEPETINLHYTNLIKLVDLKDRCLRGEIPGEIYMNLRSPEDLTSFYDHLEKTFSRLRQGLKLPKI
jgi:hypothetical protein